MLPDLRHMQPAKHLAFKEIVVDGALKDLGMVGFSDVITEDDAVGIQGYIISEAEKLQTELKRM